MQTNTETPYELAKRNYHEACRQFANAIRDEIRRLTLESCPTATEIVLDGAYGDDGEFKINLHAVKLNGGALRFEGDDDFEELTEAIDEHLLYLATTTGEDYLGRDTLTIA